MEHVIEVTCVLYYSYLILVKNLLILLVVMLNGDPACPEYQYLLFFSFRFHCFKFFNSFFRTLFWLQTCLTNYYE